MSPRVVVLDYGSGNLRSAERAIARAGAEVAVTADYGAALAADGLVVPGVGAFAACMTGLQSVKGDKVVVERVESGRPVLGICVGMQILFTEGIEHGIRADGVGVFPGAVTRLAAERVPHMGWNTVRPGAGSVLFRGIEGQRFYFVHSYAAKPGELEGPEGFDGVVTVAEHGEPFVAAVERGPVMATQFHPEKSGDAGAVLLRNWLGTLG
ncbi:MAG: imidazole glycerol phosphate synthase subunit HisH [Streptosporangiales bacterium]|nr:imidazole glycerol phosphate synthase subunit HisH [Streptosporangiales bacterium]